MAEKEARILNHLATDISSVKALQTECRTREANSDRFRLVSLIKCRLKDQNDAPGTQATYQDVSPNATTKQLFLVEYKDNHDYIEKLNDNLGKEHLFDGDGFIQKNKMVKIIAFRER